MDLEQLLDPTRLAEVWRRPPARAAQPEEHEPAPAAEPEEPAPMARPVVAPPDPRASFQALQHQVEALFAEDTEARRVVQALLDPMGQDLPAPPDLDALDDLEDVLEALLVARAWSATPGQRP